MGSRESEVDEERPGRSMSRRDFLGVAAGVVLGGAVASLYYLLTPPTEAEKLTTHITTWVGTETVRETHSVPYTVTREETKILTTTTTRTITRRIGPAPVGVVRSDSVQNSVEKAVELAGGLKKLEAGMTVMIKPNVNSDDPYPGTTNPEVIEAIVQVVQSYGPGKVIVADCSNESYWPSLDSMKKVGIHQSATRAGAQVMGLESEEWKTVKPEDASNWGGGFQVPAILGEVDYLISVPVVKTHYIATYSMALKNTVGLIDRSSRSVLHSSGEPKFGRRIAEINLAHPADYVILDATKVFVTGGPFTGDIREPRIIMATPGLVAADATGLALLKHLGTTAGVEDKSVWQQIQVQRAIELGLGVTDGTQITVVSEGVEEIDEIKKHLI